MHGAPVREIAIVAAVYPLVWGAGQLATGWVSDVAGRKPLITAGMLTQAGDVYLKVHNGKESGALMLTVPRHPACTAANAPLTGSP